MGDGGFESLFPPDGPKGVLNVQRGEDAVGKGPGGSSHLGDFVPSAVLAAGSELVRTNAFLNLTLRASNDDPHREL